MKFSVLLPTRNRLEYLRFAVESVQRQDDDNWEIIISDNCSEDDIAGYVRSLGDPRIIYVRTDSFVPVTDNWNNALDQSSGDYVVMLGDDDGLLPGYFSKMRAALASFPDPDFVYVSAFFLAYPGVMPDRPEGFVRQDRNRVFHETAPAWLDRDRALAIARGYLNFRMPVASNMQFSLISRRKIDEFRTKGPFFQSPYPDFYATPALFLTSDRILIYPEPVIAVGITPKSYGFFHFNNQSGKGLEFLNNGARLAAVDVSNDDIVLPGTSYNDSWLLANEALSANFAAERGLRLDYRRYRFLQIVHSYKHRYFDRSISGDVLVPLRRRMKPSERFLGGGMAAGFGALRLIPAGWRETAILRLRRLIGQHSISEEEPFQRRFADLLELYDALDSREAAPHGA